jgi:aspartyl/asparaginyl-tRNA synthetase
MTHQHPVDQTRTSSIPFAACFSAPGKPLPLNRRLRVHNRVVQRIRAFLQEGDFVEVPVPTLTAAALSGEATDSLFCCEYFDRLAFPRISGQLRLEKMLAGTPHGPDDPVGLDGPDGLDAVYCEGESLRREWKVDERHLTEFKLIEVARRGMSLDELMTFQEALVKDVARHLSADLLGGCHVTRLDRMINKEHPRLTYREALAVLNQRGWSMPFGEDLHRDAEATLSRYCGNLPVHVSHWPAELELFNAKLDRDDPAVVESVDYILPYAGETISGTVREDDVALMRQRLEESVGYRHLMSRAAKFAQDQSGAESEELSARYQSGIESAFGDYLRHFANRTIERAGFSLGVARLLQYVMGLESIKDAVIFPLDRTSLSDLSDSVRRRAAATGSA